MNDHTTTQRVNIVDAVEGDEMLQAGQWVRIASVHPMTSSSSVVVRFANGGSMAFPREHDPAVRRHVAAGNCWCGSPATYRVPVDPWVSNPNTNMSDGQPAMAVCESHMDRDGYEPLPIEKPTSAKARCYLEFCCNTATNEVVVENRSSDHSRPAVAWGWCNQHKHLSPNAPCENHVEVPGQNCPTCDF